MCLTRDSSAIEPLPRRGIGGDDHHELGPPRSAQASSRPFGRAGALADTTVPTRLPHWQRTPTPQYHTGWRALDTAKREQAHAYAKCMQKARKAKCMQQCSRWWRRRCRCRADCNRPSGCIDHITENRPPKDSNPHPHQIESTSHSHSHSPLDHSDTAHAALRTPCNIPSARRRKEERMAMVLPDATRSLPPLPRSGAAPGSAPPRCRGGHCA